MMREATVGLLLVFATSLPWCTKSYRVAVPSQQRFVTSPFQKWTARNNGHPNYNCNPDHVSVKAYSSGPEGIPSGLQGDGGGLVREVISNLSDDVGGQDETSREKPITRKRLKRKLVKASGRALLLATALATAPLSRTRAEGRRDTTLLPPVGTNKKRLLLVRHGQTDLNTLMVCQGRRLNPPLNVTGRMQAHNLLLEADVKAIFCSPLLRARETASIVHDTHPSASFSVCDDLNEIDFGGAEGLPQPLALAYLAPTYLSWSEGRYDRRAGLVGESGARVQQRAFAAAETLLSACDFGGQVVGVSHSAVLKVILATLLNVPLSVLRGFGQENCAVNALDFDMSSGAVEAVVINNQLVRGRAELMARTA